MSDPVCKCGHVQEDHLPADQHAHQPCVVRHRETGKLCPCTKYHDRRYGETQSTGAKSVLVGLLCLALAACAELSDYGVCTVTDKMGVGGWGSPDVVVSLTCDGGFAFGTGSHRCRGYSVGARVHVTTMGLRNDHRCVPAEEE